MLLLEIKEVKLYKEEQNKTIYAVLTKWVDTAPAQCYISVNQKG